MTKKLQLTETQLHWLWRQIHYGLGDVFDPSYARTTEERREMAIDRRIRDNIEKKLEELL